MRNRPVHAEVKSGGGRTTISAAIGIFVVVTAVVFGVIVLGYGFLRSNDEQASPSKAGALNHQASISDLEADRLYARCDGLQVGYQQCMSWMSQLVDIGRRNGCTFVQLVAWAPYFDEADVDEFTCALQG